MHSICLRLIMTLCAISLGTSAFADRMPAELQSLKIQEIARRYEGLKQNQEALIQLSEALSNAKRMEGGWEVILDTGKSTVNWSKWFLIPALFLRAAISYYPTEAFYRVAKTPTNIIITLAGVTLASGVVTQAGAVYKLNLSEAERIKAQNSIVAVNQVMNVERAAIAELSKDLGAKVVNNVVSFEGIPEGIKALGGTMLNLSDLSVQ